jgi:hypothetical protein
LVCRCRILLVMEQKSAIGITGLRRPGAGGERTSGKQKPPDREQSGGFSMESRLKLPAASRRECACCQIQGPKRFSRSR